MRTLLFLLAAAAGASSFAADFLPLEPGNTWTYRDAATGSTFDVDIGATQVFVNQQTYHALRGYTPKPVLVRVNQFGNLAYWDEERQTELLLTSFEVVPGARFEAPARMCPQEGQVQEKRAVHAGPVGPWSALEIQYRTSACADAGDQLERFVENIGMVRRVVNTIAGPRAYDLVYARVGDQVITAGSTGSFSVSATNVPEVGNWLVTLRLQLPNGPPFKLKFPSGQEYDLKLRDSNGQILWTWSADKLFVQAEHELQIDGRWTATVSVPYPPATPEGPHIYTIEARLTAAATEPQFGAVTRVEILAPMARVARSR